MTPRQAAKSVKGRRLLDDLITVFSSDGRGLAPDDLTTLMNPTEDEIRKEPEI